MFSFGSNHQNMTTSYQREMSMTCAKHKVNALHQHVDNVQMNLTTANWWTHDTRKYFTEQQCAQISGIWISSSNLNQINNLKTITVTAIFIYYIVMAIVGAVLRYKTVYVYGSQIRNPMMTLDQSICSYAEHLVEAICFIASHRIIIIDITDFEWIDNINIFFYIMQWYSCTRSIVCGCVSPADFQRQILQFSILTCTDIDNMGFLYVYD